MSITDPQGFLASGIHCGIKSSGEMDLALVASQGTGTDTGVSSAAVFTTNKLPAAPVLVSKANLLKSKQRTKAVILNSGCANAATGDQGELDAKNTCLETAKVLGVNQEDVLVCSTGLIGRPLPAKKILSSIPKLVEGLSQSGSNDAAKAIMTTDTHPKEHTEKGDGFLVGGIAKGAAMLAPNMATMLAVITTDADCANPAKNLPLILADAVNASFNRTSVDGVQSTNDTVILLASGKAGEQPPEKVAAAVTATCKKLAQQMVGDAEGGTRTVGLFISGAPNQKTADHAVRHLANSLLLKCSWYGGDPYWGRLVSELGAAGIVLDLNSLTLSYGDHTVFSGGIENQVDETSLATYMSGKHLDIFVDLGLGDAKSDMLTCDLGYGYIEENSKTS